eukprot:156644_1
MSLQNSEQKCHQSEKDKGNTVALNVQVMMQSKHIHFIIEIQLTVSVRILKHRIQEHLTQNHNHEHLIPKPQYFDVIGIFDPHLSDVFELSEEDCLMDIITNPMLEWIYLFNASDTATSQIKPPQNIPSGDTNHCNLFVNNAQQNQDEERQNLLLWHAYQGAKYTSKENSRLARVDEIHYRFFGSMIAILKHLNLWNNNIIRANVIHDMYEHGLIDNDLANTINFGLQLTQHQVLDLVAMTRWIPSETMPSEVEQTNSNNKRETRPLKRYNCALGLCMYFRKAFDGRIAKTGLTLEVKQKHFRDFGKFLQLQDTEIQYLQLLYQTEQNMSAWYRMMLWMN